MTIQDAKQIKLADYLKSLGYTPIKQQGKSLWYKSPLRNETDASFKVNTELNQWYDFGIGKGGNIIALAAELYHNNNVAYLLERIAERTPYIRPASFSFGEQRIHNCSFQGIQVGELSSPALIDYLRGRGINIELAKKNVRSCDLNIITNHTSPSVSPISLVAMSFATATSKVVLLQRILPISDSRASSEMCVTSLKALWIIFRSLQSE